MMSHSKPVTILLAGIAATSTIIALSPSVLAAPADFDTYTVENYPIAANNGNPFGTPTWTVDNGGTSASESTNASNTVFYSPENILNTRITGILNAGGDDDMVGFVLGFNPGDADGTNANADFILIDWKGVTQGFDFTDPTGDPDFQNLTGGTEAPAGIAISRVNGLPTADELWGHMDLPENPGGSVEQLARGNNFGDVGYDRTGLGHEIEIIYEADRIQMSIDGVPEFDISGNFGDGRFGLYEGFQSPGAGWSDFAIVPEPSSLLLLVLGLVGALGLARRDRRHG